MIFAKELTYTFSSQKSKNNISNTTTAMQALVHLKNRERITFEILTIKND